MAMQSTGMLHLFIPISFSCSPSSYYLLQSCYSDSEIIDECASDVRTSDELLNWELMCEDWRSMVNEIEGFVEFYVMGIERDSFWEWIEGRWIELKKIWLSYDDDSL